MNLAEEERCLREEWTIYARGGFEVHHGPVAEVTFQQVEQNLPPHLKPFAPPIETFVRVRYLLVPPYAATSETILGARIWVGRWAKLMGALAQSRTPRPPRLGD